MTIVDEGRQASKQSPEGTDPESNAQVRPRARRSLTFPTRTAATAVTKSARGAGARVTEKAKQRDSLVHTQPPTFHETWTQHRECAQHYQAALLRCPRYAWAAFHVTVIKPLADGFQWVMFSPARAIVTAAIVAIIWFYS